MVESLIKANEVLGGLLRRKTTKGVLWMSLGKGVVQTASFVKLAILARLLTPEDFGVMGIALFALGLLETFTQTGFDIALIQRRGDIHSYYDVAFTVQVIRGFILACVIWFGAPYIALFFESPSASLVLQSLGVVVILRGFTNPAVVTLNRELEFAKVFVWNLSEAVLSLLTAIALALIFSNIWALVGASIAGQSAKTIMSYMLVKNKPRPVIDFARMADLSQFGIWVLLSNAVVFLSLQADNAFVGKMLGTTALGFYQVAFRISDLPVSSVTHVISQVTFPLFSRFQSHRSELRARYVHVFQFLALVNGLIAVLLFVFADELTSVVLGDKWLNIVPILRILIISNFFRSLFAFGGWLFYAVGEAKLNFHMNVLRLMVMAVLIYPLSESLGLLGVSIAVLASTFSLGLIYARGVRSILNLSVKDHLVMGRYLHPH